MFCSLYTSLADISSDNFKQTSSIENSTFNANMVWNSVARKLEQKTSPNCSYPKKIFEDTKLSDIKLQKWIQSTQWKGKQEKKTLQLFCFLIFTKNYYVDVPIHLDYYLYPKNFLVNEGNVTASNSFSAEAKVLNQLSAFVSCNDRKV